MTAFLYLQKFTDGVPAAMPYQPLIDILSRFGKLGRGAGDLEVILPPDMVAAGCTVIGDSESGISCVGFERPRFDADLRRVVWACVQTAGCAVFDDSLETVCVPPDGIAALPEKLKAASVNGVRQISSAQQLWPEDSEIGVNGPSRPVLLYKNANPAAPNYQFFDYLESEKCYLYIDVRIRPEACNPGTLRIHRNLELRVNAALTANPEYNVFYQYENYDSPLCVMESERLSDQKMRATIISPPPPGFGGAEPRTPFVADREVFASETDQAMAATAHAHEKYQLALDGGVATIEVLARFLDKLHLDYLQERDAQRSAHTFVSAAAAEWAKLAGAYLGTLIRQHVGAQWGYMKRGQQRLLAVRTHRGRNCLPHHLVLDHIINGPKSNVAAYFYELIRTGLSASPRDEDVVCNIPGYCQILIGKSHFSGGAGLPLEALIPRAKLDFGVSSLRDLDLYLAQVVRQRATFSALALSSLALAAGAYLGEVIRSNSLGAGDWRWASYDDFALENPEFASKRPREWGLLAILDSDTQMTYPVAHVTLILQGMDVATSFAQAQQLTGKTGHADALETEKERAIQPADAAVKTEPAPKAPNKTKTAPPVFRDLSGLADVQQADPVIDGIAAVFGWLPRVLTWITLAYGVQGPISEFTRIAGSLSAVIRVPGILWIASPYILLAWVAFRAEKNMISDVMILGASAMIMLFGMGVYGTSPWLSSDLADAAVFGWAPLVQLIWAGMWIFILNRRAE